MTGEGPSRSGDAVRGGPRVRGLLLALGALIFPAAPACYDVPKPPCGFRCGPGQACPEDYTCNPADERCHLNGSPVSLVCGTVDGGVDAPTDATADTPQD